MSGSIKVAVIGVGNCASSLIQGIYYYGDANGEVPPGLLHNRVGGYAPGDIKIVAAYDVDKRKIGKDVNEAIYEKPNNTTVFNADVPPTGTIVRMGNVLDGVAPHMADYKDDRTFLVSDADQPTVDDVVAHLKEVGAEIIMNYLPVGSQKATEFYAEVALKGGFAFVNNIPVFIASNPEWAERFRVAGVPVIGDDIKAQVGATIVHRVLTDLFAKRGVPLDRTYQLNTGGNTDFLNMKSQDRLASKKISKTEAVRSVAGNHMDDDDIHIGPSDYVPWQNDNKICFLRMEGQLFGGVPMDIELRLSVEDSPNSGGVAVETIRCAKLALERGLAGPIHAPSSFFCKHPAIQITDDDARERTEAFIAGASPDITLDKAAE